MLNVALISSGCLRAHTTRNRPFAGSDEVTGPGGDNSDGSCIVLLGGIGRTSELTARHPAVTIPIVKLSRDTRDR